VFISIEYLQSLEFLSFKVWEYPYQLVKSAGVCVTFLDISVPFLEKKNRLSCVAKLFLGNLPRPNYVEVNRRKQVHKLA